VTKGATMDATSAVHADTRLITRGSTDEPSPAADPGSAAPSPRTHGTVRGVPVAGYLPRLRPRDQRFCLL
jgi:hypothetical protein